VDLDNSSRNLLVAAEHVLPALSEREPGAPQQQTPSPSSVRSSERASEFLLEIEPTFQEILDHSLFGCELDVVDSEALMGHFFVRPSLRPTRVKPCLAAKDLKGCLAHKKPPPSRTLQSDHA